ncbi:MAG: hypothetical protein BGN88_15345 [Clostridiales bacterium 43-6]|nr:MAG: hypothetical protein BGN88_15345 [Clostridiales bacterium 43-6]
MDRFIGKRIDGRYEIRELIGIGGMAIVYKAYDNIDDRTVAIKILKEEFLANEEFRRRFKNESKAIAVLSHPNIVKVYDVSFGDILQYIVMEYIDGITLKEYIDQQGVIRWKDAMHFITQVLKALQHAHEKGIVHRDIKPQNIILLPDGSIKVTDFGIARFSHSEKRTITDKAIGSVHYISPEQARGDFTDEKADIYSVGVLIYEMITGRLPFQADSAVSVAIMQLQNEPQKPTEINASIPKGLEEIILHAMQKEPKNRYKTAADMLSDIEEFKRNPQVVFGYTYSQNEEPTKYIPDLGIENDEEEEEEKPAPVVPILAGVAAAFVIVILIVGVIGWNLIFNSSTKSVSCPKLVGMNIDDAREKYKGQFEIKELSWDFNSEYEMGIIYEQVPEANKQIKQKSTISVKISKGKSTFALDNVEGFEVKSALETLTDQGLKPNVVKRNDDKVALDFVISTDPPKGTRVSTGDEITVYVSLGAVVLWEDVPDVTFISKDDAKKLLESKGFTFTIKTIDDPNTQEGIVKVQDPAAGKKAPLGSTVILTVSTGHAPPVTTPTTVTYTANLNVTLPKNINKKVILTAELDGVKVHQSSEINLSVAKNYSFTVKSTQATGSLIIYLSDYEYKQYAMNFQTGLYTMTYEDPLDELRKTNASTAANTTAKP